MGVHRQDVGLCVGVCVCMQGWRVLCVHMTILQGTQRANILFLNEQTFEGNRHQQHHFPGSLLRGAES